MALALVVRRPPVDVLPQPAVLVHAVPLALEVLARVVRMQGEVHEGAAHRPALDVLDDARQRRVERQDAVEVVLVEQVTLDVVLEEQAREVVLALVAAEDVAQVGGARLLVEVGVEGLVRDPGLEVDDAPAGDEVAGVAVVLDVAECGAGVVAEAGARLLKWLAALPNV
ncbi:hypothetical protein CH063_14036 [Colletotrichum higginsianum]|uniref:Uncharacterized protein n=1 Tax=Colletotrichum higginsianum (strain IMI 349063) TaxID=759273 RepID=H1VWX3_COLHI|nr:hypothetical protein CH063_14036 [Colletotrichum higginsianum]